MEILIKGKIPRRERERLARREEILKAAKVVFASKGYHNATMEDIATEAELGKGTIYLYFHDKKELFSALVQEGIDHMTQAIEDGIRSGESALQKIEKFIQAEVSYLNENIDLLKVIVFERGDLERELFSEFKNLKSRYLKTIKLLSTIIEEGIKAGEIKNLNPQKLATFLIGIIHSFIVHYIKGNERGSFGSEAPLIAELFFKGVRRT